MNWRCRIPVNRFLQLTGAGELPRLSGSHSAHWDPPPSSIHRLRDCRGLLQTQLGTRHLLLITPSVTGHSSVVSGRSSVVLGHFAFVVRLLAPRYSLLSPRFCRLTHPPPLVTSPTPGILQRWWKANLKRVMDVLF